MSITSPTTRWMTPPPIYDSHSTSQGSTTLNPYLSLSHLLSLTWLAYPILSLLFVAFRLQLSSASAQDAVSDAKGNLLTSCKAAEQAATAAASLPRYMAAATNQQIADAVNGTMNAARAALILSLTVVETIINFVIDIYRSTFLCFLELVVRGGLSILISAVQEISDFIENTLGTIRTSIQNDVSTANSAISSAVSAINKVNPFGNISVPQFSIPSLSSLENVTIPTDFEDALVKLNASLPTVDQLRNVIDSVVDSPFELLKSDINDTFTGLSFDPSILPVPEQNSLSFCGQLDTSIVDDLGRDLLKAAKIGTVVLIILALLLLAGNCALEWYKWRCMHVELERIRQAWMSDPTVYHTAPTKSEPTLRMTDHNLLILAATSSHPLLTRIANRLSALLRLTPAQHTHLRWFFHYIFHPPALACFLIGFFGLLSVQLQLVAIGPLEAKYSNQVASSITDFSTIIATSMNASMYNQSTVYANDINGRVDNIQSTINDGVFGWVNGTTTTLNDTLNTFYSDIQNAVSTVFNGTILENPIQDFVKCIIGSKVEALEDALTFLHNNLQVDIPRVNDSILVLSPADINEAAQPISRAAIGGGSGGDQGLVGTLVNRYVESLKKERIMFGVFMGLWGIVLLMAICILLYHSYWVPSVETRRKRKWKNEQRGGFEGIVVPYKVERYVSPDAPSDEKALDLPSFTPTILQKSGGFFSNIRSPPSPHPSSRDMIDVNNRGVPGAHPLAALKPSFEKSWDSILDSDIGHHSAASSQEIVAPAKRVPRKLTAIGRKAMGRERFVSDEERARLDAAAVLGEPVGQDVTWFKKILTSFQKRDTVKRMDQVATPGLPVDGSLTRPKPQLTISTDLMPEAENNRLPALETEAPTDNYPGSAWSVSPGPSRSVPWLPLQTASRRPPVSSTTPFHSKPRRNASVPYSVSSSYGPSSFDASRTAAFNPIAAPMHQSVQRPVPETPMSVYPPSVIYQTPYRYPVPVQRHLAPPIDHRRSTSVPLISPGLFTQWASPGTRTLTSTHARQSSHAVDPFRTPFDDDASTPHRQSVRKSTNTPTNPFSAFAL